MNDPRQDLASMRRWHHSMRRMDAARRRHCPKRTWWQIIADRLPLV